MLKLGKLRLFSMSSSSSCLLLSHRCQVPHPAEVGNHGMELAFLSLIHYHTFGGVPVNLHPSCAQLHLGRQPPLTGPTHLRPVSAPEHEVCVCVLSPICILPSPGEVEKHPVLGPGAGGEARARCSKSDALCGWSGASPHGGK